MMMRKIACCCLLGASLAMVLADAGAETPQVDPAELERVQAMSVQELFDEAAVREEAAAHVRATQSPNVLVLIGDDMGAADVAWNNDDEFNMPTLSWLNEHGARLRRFYSHPSCTPTRSAFLTGVFAPTLGAADGPILPIQRRCLSNKFPLLPELLRDNGGYSTALVGKWHLGHSSVECYPTQRGFDSFVGILNGAVDHYKHDIGLQCGTEANNFTAIFADDCQLLNAHDLASATVSAPGLKRYPNARTFSTEVFTRHAMDVLWNHNNDGSTDKPLYLQVAYTAVHTPSQSEEKDTTDCTDLQDTPQAYQPWYRKDICGMAVSIDRSVRHLLETLFFKRMLTSTAIVFFSDNGGLLQAGSVNTPFRSGKATSFEGGVRTPAFLYYGRNVPAQDVDGMFHVVDLFPTLLSMAGVSLSEEEAAAIDGIDEFDNLVEENDMARTMAVLQSDTAVLNFSSGIIQDSMKYMHNPGTPINFALGWQSAPSGEFLFNLTVDPYETTNLIDNPDYQEVAEEMRAAMQTYRESTPPTDVVFPPQPETFPSLGACWMAMDDPGYWPVSISLKPFSVKINKDFQFCWLLMHPFSESQESEHPAGLNTDLAQGAQYHGQTQEEFQQFWLEQSLVDGGDAMHAAAQQAAENAVAKASTLDAFGMSF